MPKRPNPMSINKALTYTIEEAARALSVTPATIRNYIRRGLPVMKRQRPFLISGEQLRAFLVHERQQKKKPLKHNELFCPACGHGQRPFGLMVDLVPNSEKTGLLVGLCETCDSTSTRIIGLRRLPEFAEIFEITERATKAA